ncbi:hypothetical protein MVEN_01697300 [Mycena venus]|uniref:Uncharacterized protein n=1 Tax=Mycena venus TaxID=2733690 RepID=A0A8H6XPC8_9AGAR|nr:hypothetical protein MVEN_01697300 [Mycena venus]
MLSYSKSALIGIVLENLAYGLYLSYFIQCLQIILARKNAKSGASIRLLLITLVLFFLITLRMVLDNKGVVEAFTYAPTTPNAADIYLQSFGNGAMFRTGTYIALTIVADIFIVYRVYAVWGGSFMAAVLPCLLAIADIVTGGLLIQAIRELAAGASPDGHNVSTHAIIFYSFTLSLNVLCTFLISLRIYLTQRRAKGIIASGLDLGMTMTIVIESAALYSACLIAMIVPTALGNNVQFCLLSVMPGIVGIAFSLIIVRMGAGLSPHSTGRAGDAPMSVLQFAGSQTRGRTRGTVTGTRTGTGTEMDGTTDDIADDTDSDGNRNQLGLGIQLHLDGHSQGTQRSRGTGASWEGEGKEGGKEGEKEEV